MAKEKSKKPEKRNLPVLRSLINQVRTYEIFIPEMFRAPTNTMMCMEAMRSYYDRTILKDSFCKIMEDYRRIEEKAGDLEHELLKPMPETKALQRFISGGVLAEYRKEHGLDKLKKEMLEGLVKAASFERGVDIIHEHLMSPENDSKADVEVSDTAARIAAEKEGVIDGKLTDIALFYPDLTADEIAWISLTFDKKKQWVFDKPSYMYWPPSLIEIDLNGLVFAQGTIDDSAYDNINTSDPWQMGGITGIDGQTAMLLFHPNVARIVKALTLLSIDDNDLYDKLMKEEDIVPLLRGDELLVKSFRGLNGIPEELLEDIIKSDNRYVREEIMEFFNKSYFDCSYVNQITDFVRLIGTLERVPEFVDKKKPFRGYVKIYGTNVSFIDESGKIVDSIPIVSHLAHRIAYQFSDRINQFDRKDTILREIFEELARKISEKNYAEKNQMPSDILQDRLLEQGIFVPNQTYTRIEEVSKATFFGKKFTSPERLVRTVKFSFDELVDILKILDDVPAYLRRGVAGIVKKTSEYLSIEELSYDQKTAGTYSPENKIITLSLPIRTPYSKNEADLNVRVLLEKMSSRKMKQAEEERVEIERFKIRFCKTLAHEIGESIYALDKGIAAIWDAVETNVPKGVLLEEMHKYFLTAYSTKAPNEDFADTFAMYLLFGDQFRELCTYPVIKKKYELMKKLFSADGQEYEFEDKFGCSMYLVSNRPNVNIEERLQESALRDTLQDEAIFEDHQRLETALTMGSYQDVEGIIDSYEERGTPISREEATRIMFEKNEEVKETLDRHFEKKLFSHSLQSKTLLMAYSSSFDVSRFVFDYYIFQRHMLNGDKSSAQKLLQRYGAPEKTAKNIIKTLTPIYKNAGDVIEEDLIKKEDTSEDVKTQLMSILEFLPPFKL